MFYNINIKSLNVLLFVLTSKITWVFCQSKETRKYFHLSSDQRLLTQGLQMIVKKCVFKCLD